jgi:lipoprotein-anchoring transpeptidase ErfK/SrfK
MLQRKPELREHMTQLQSGIGMRGGPKKSPIGARALYLWQVNKDTLYRIHGTNEPWTIYRPERFIRLHPFDQ